MAQQTITSKVLNSTCAEVCVHVQAHAARCIREIKTILTEILFNSEGDTQSNIGLFRLSRKNLVSPFSYQ